MRGAARADARAQGTAEGGGGRVAGGRTRGGRGSKRGNAGEEKGMTAASGRGRTTEDPLVGIQDNDAEVKYRVGGKGMEESEAESAEWSG